MGEEEQRVRGVTGTTESEVRAPTPRPTRAASTKRR